MISARMTFFNKQIQSEEDLQEISLSELSVALQ